MITVVKTTTSTTTMTTTKATTTTTTMTTTKATTMTTTKATTTTTTTMTTTKATTTTGSTTASRQVGTKDDSSKTVTIGAVVAGLAVLIATLFILVLYLKKKIFKSNFDHVSFQNLVDTQPSEPTAGTSGSSDRPDSGTYDLIEDLKREKTNCREEDDARKSTNPYVTLKSPGAESQREKSHVYNVMSEREALPLPIVHPSHLAREWSDPYMQPTTHANKSGDMARSFHNPDYLIQNKAFDRTDFALPRSPEKGNMFLSAPKVPEELPRESVASMDHLQDYMTPTVPRDEETWQKRSKESLPLLSFFDTTKREPSLLHVLSEREAPPVLNDYRGHMSREWSDPYLQPDTPLRREPMAESVHNPAYLMHKGADRTENPKGLDFPRNSTTSQDSGSILFSAPKVTEEPLRELKKEQ